MLTAPNIKNYTTEGRLDEEAWDTAWDDYEEACIDNAEARHDDPERYN